ncbi:MAG: protein translocase subunit SecD [Methylococcales bacterium]|nr:protein translocase subunit SecD [Methylococcales bacterium]
MQNRFPWWKNLLIIVVLAVAALYALPNLFGDDPAVQVSGPDVTEPESIRRLQAVLAEQNLPVKSIDSHEHYVLLRFADIDTQLKAADRLKPVLQSDQTLALNLAPATPSWLQALGGKPMYLGLDLRGGVHFLLEVDMDAALQQAQERFYNDIKAELREKHIRYRTVRRDGDAIVVKVRDAELAEAENALAGAFSDLTFQAGREPGQLLARLREPAKLAIKKFALEQNITTLRNRVNELGVAEPVIQQQGDSRIVVQLPGVQDTTRAKDILGTTATLEYRLVDVGHDPYSAQTTGSPAGTRLYQDKTGSPVLLEDKIIVTGDQIVDASSGLDQNGSPSVFITLNGLGARKMGKITQDNIGRPMAVVFIEYKTQTELRNGQRVRHKEKHEKVISVATIRDAFSKRFQTTGLDSPQEARNLALLLRAGALAAPVDIIEERTVGPSLGQDNIDQGMRSVLVGFVVVLVFMALYYRVFGWVANLALMFNLVLIIAALSLLQATLTLPGIAGIVLTIGMAVDANVLIFERIKEELRNGNSPQAAIYSGYEKAFATIFDANITTLLVATILFGFGSGPVKGFAVTLSLGILSSMFTAVTGSRMVVNALYGQRRGADLKLLRKS